MVVCKLGIRSDKCMSNSNLPNKYNQYHLYSISTKISETVYAAQRKKLIYIILEPMLYYLSLRLKINAKSEKLSIFKQLDKRDYVEPVFRMELQY
jgi:hypothetical protein